MNSPVVAVYLEPRAYDDWEYWTHYWVRHFGLARTIQYDAELQQHLDFLFENPFVGTVLRWQPHEIRKWVAHPNMSIIHEWHAAESIVRVLSLWDNRQNPDRLWL